MKILMLEHPEQDFGAFYLFNGLCQILGDDNVVTYPYKKSYYGEIDKDYILDDGKVGFTAPSAYMVSRKADPWTFDEVKNRMDEFSFILLAAPRTYAINAYKDILKAFGKKPKPLVFTDHEDSATMIREKLIKGFQPDLIFRREMLKKEEDFYSLPFSCPANKQREHPDKQEKNIDVFVLLGNTHRYRKQVVERLLKMNLKNSYIGLDSGIIPYGKDGRFKGEKAWAPKPLLSYKRYLDYMSRAKINISIRGWGIDTCRRWEIMYYSGLGFCDRLPLVTPNNFTDKENIIFYENLDDLERKILYYLEHDSEREEIGKRGREHSLKYHTNIARAEYFLEIVKNKLGI